MFVIYFSILLLMFIIYLRKMNNTHIRCNTALDCPSNTYCRIKRKNNILNTNNKKGYCYKHYII